MKYLLLFIYATLNTILCMGRYIVVATALFIWKFKIAKYGDVITNHILFYSKYKSIPSFAPSDWKYDRNPIETFIRTLKMSGSIIEY